MKKCSRCGYTQPKSQFGKNQSRCDGLDEYCIACRREYAATWRGYTGPNKQERELLVASHTVINPPQKERREKFVREYVESLQNNMW